jgi:hypothetical protein
LLPAAYIEKNIAVHLLRRGFVAHHAQHEAIDGNAMAREQRSHSPLIAFGDVCDENFVRNCWHRQPIGSCIRQPRGAQVQSK